MQHPTIKIPKGAALITILIMVVMIFFSAMGLFFPELVYPTAELRSTFITNDLVNLIIGLPVLVIPLVLAQRGHSIGFLLWPGSLFFVFYNSVSYTWALLPKLMAVPYAILTFLSGLVMIRLLAGMDGSALRERLSGRVLEWLAGGVLVALALMIGFRNIGVLSGSSAIAETDLAVLVADFSVIPLWFAAGFSLIRRGRFGYAAGLASLFHASMLFVGLVALMILQPFLTGESFPAVDIMVIAGMGVLCLVPFFLFLRTAALSDKKSVQ